MPRTSSTLTRSQTILRRKPVPTTNKENSPSTTTTTTTTIQTTHIPNHANNANTKPTPSTQHHLKSPYSRPTHTRLTSEIIHLSRVDLLKESKLKKRNGYSELSIGGVPRSNRRRGGGVGVGGGEAGNEVVKRYTTEKKVLVPLRLPRVRIDPVDQESLNKECDLDIVSLFSYPKGFIRSTK
jgi:hypothetical protein